MLANLRGQGYLGSGILFSRERLDGARIFGCSFESTLPRHKKLDRRTQEEPGRGVFANLRGLFSGLEEEFVEASWSKHFWVQF